MSSQALARQHAAARVRVQADDARAGLRRELDELVDLEQRNAELRVHAGRAHVLVMAAALARVDADEDLLALEALRPMLQRKQVVERHPDALLERLLVLCARREIRREQNALAVDVRQHLEHARNLARRDALDVQAAVVHELQDLAVRIRLHRVEHRVDGLQRRAAPRWPFRWSRGRRRRWRRVARRSRAAAPSS